MTNAELFKKNRIEDRAKFLKWAKDHAKELKASSDAYYEQLKTRRGV